MAKYKTSRMIALALAGLLGLVAFGLLLPPLPRTKARPMKATARNAIHGFSVTLTNEAVATSNVPLLTPNSAAQQ